MARKFLIVGSFAAIYLLWGSTYLAIAIGLQSIPPFTLMGFRSLCGGLVLIALCGKGISRISRQTWLNAGLCGLLFFAGCHGVLAWAEQTVASGVAAIALATIPLWIQAIDLLLSKAGNDRHHHSLLPLLPGFLGVAIVAWQNIGAGRASLVSILALLLASLSWALGTVLSRSAPDDGGTVLRSGMQLSIGGVALFAMAFLAGEIQDFTPNAVSARSLEAAVYLAVAGSVIGFAAYHWLLKNVSTMLVATYTFVNPVVAVILGVAVLGEQLSTAAILGAFLVVVSIVAMWAAENLGHRHASPKPGRSASLHGSNKKKGAPAFAGAPQRSGHCRVCAQTEVVDVGLARPRSREKTQ